MDISTLERAAGTLLAPPNLVSADERRQAENYFQDLKKSISMEEAMHILHQTENSFVLFEMAQAVGELTLRDWSLLDPQVVEATYKTLLEFVAARETLESYVIAEFLKTIAIIVKRGSLSGNDREDLYKFIHNLLMHQSPKLQSLGCRFISALIEQFSSAWRNSKFSITWDFHLKAKTEFEVTGLRRLLEFSLTTLHALNGQENILNDEFTKRLCEKFLEVAENILSWNFSSKLTRRFLCVNTVFFF
ncbi:unnamed protein product [Caenorhabditis auriculariae]|uniref:Exportin-4 n=1 Tax=Caenorhabditis auriculariae TaxID=2777116 RepID=A0A8S1HDF7_9PELO|nr:unnamed protein product [Caenorhabditis auriculariae]